MTTVRRSANGAMVKRDLRNLRLPIFYMSEAIFLGWVNNRTGRHAADYMWILAPAIIPSLWANVMRSYLSAMEFTKVIMLITRCRNFERGFNHVLIFGNYGFPELGIRGRDRIAIGEFFDGGHHINLCCLYIASAWFVPRFYRPD